MESYYDQSKGHAFLFICDTCHRRVLVTVYNNYLFCVCCEKKFCVDCTGKMKNRDTFNIKDLRLCDKCMPEKPKFDFEANLKTPGGKTRIDGPDCSLTPY